jgi:hypothetical protein
MYILGMCLDFQYFDSKQDYNLQIVVFWCVTQINLVDGHGTDDSEGFAAYIFRADDGGIMLLRNVGIRLHGVTIHG